MNPHTKHELFSLHLHKKVRDIIIKNPERYNDVKKILNNWIKMHPGEKCFEEWQDYLELGLEYCIQRICDWDEKIIQMRQSSPFSCVLNRKESIEFREWWNNNRSFIIENYINKKEIK